MGSDKARRSYDASRMYRSVVSQQGRVTVEADANEGEELRAAEARADLVDVIGPTGAPADGFKISVPAGSAPSDFAIGAGALYVGGMRVVNANPGATYNGQSKIPAEWNGHPVEWVDVPAQAPASGSPELIFLTLAEQEVTAVEDPPLRESALGGPDTAARTRLIQRVKRFSVPQGGCELGFAHTVKALYSQRAAFDGATMRLTSRARLRVDFVPTAGGADPCQPTAQAGFLGADNQLIRVQVSERIGDDQTFLWGWDNASTLYRVETTTLGPRVLHVTSIPVDQFHEPQQGQRVELLATAVKLDDDAYVASETGPVFEVDSYDAGTRMLTLTTDVTLDFTRDCPPQLFIRIWENQLRFAANESTAVPLVYPNNTGIGLAIHATAGGWFPGDFWMIAARPSTPDKILPARLTTLQPPDGPRRWLAPLAVINWFQGDGETTVSDCRPPFLNLVELTRRKGEPSGEGGCCELVVAPGEDIQAAIDSLPEAGGAVCLKAGTHQIERPLRIDRSFVTLRGESGGTIIETTPQNAGLTGVMLEIRTGDQGLTDIVVRDLAFVVTKAPAVSVIAPFISIERCTRAQVRDCRFTAPPLELNATLFGMITVDECRDLTIADNTGRWLNQGIFATRCFGQMDVLRNALSGYSVTAMLPSGATREYAFGWYGIALAGGAASAQARVENNRLDNFGIGIGVGALAHSTIANNTILRALYKPDPIESPPVSDAFPPVSDPVAMNKYLGHRQYAVACISDGCAIRGNRIDLQSSWWGGIHTTGRATLVDANVIESSVNVEEDKGMAAGIYCTGEIVSGAHRSRLYDNVLTGPQVAITITSCNDVEVVRNQIDGAGSAAHAIRLDDAAGALIKDNQITRTSAEYPRPAIFARKGDRNRFEGNHIDTSTLGIKTEEQTDIVIVGNRIEAAGVAGIWVDSFDRTATVCGNRVIHCGAYTDASDPCVGIRLVGKGSGPTLRLEDCEIVDLGIPTFGGLGPDVARGFWAENVAACQMVGNRVGYTDFNKLDPAQSRAPLLVNGLLASVDNAEGQSLISGNDLAGSAERGLVTVQRFRTVTFSNNICRHRTRENAGAATVQLAGMHLIAMGNHIEADHPVVPSLKLEQCRKAVLSGNATSGPLDPGTTGQVVPHPYTNFNVIL